MSRYQILDRLFCWSLLLLRRFALCSPINTEGSAALRFTMRVQQYFYSGTAVVQTTPFQHSSSHPNTRNRAKDLTAAAACVRFAGVGVKRTRNIYSDLHIIRVGLFIMQKKDNLQIIYGLDEHLVDKPRVNVEVDQNGTVSDSLFCVVFRLSSQKKKNGCTEVGRVTWSIVTS